MATIAVDVSEDDALASVECEISWFKLLIGDLEVTVSFEQMDSIHAAVRPYFVEDEPAPPQDSTPTAARKEDGRG